MNTEKHKHADLIKSWADGHKIEIKNEAGSWSWIANPSWAEECEYRILDPFKELKLAHANGAIIQYFSMDNKWIDVSNNCPMWCPENKYRIKPNPPERQPLSMESMPQSQSLWIKLGNVGNHFQVISIGPRFISIFSSAGLGAGPDDITYWELMAKNYYYSADGRKTWHPCYR